MTGKEVQKWSDKAMFESEPLDAGKGPTVKLLSMNADPLGEIASACLMYEGKVIRDLSEVTYEQRKHYLAEMVKTKLKAPLEFVKFHFLIEGVTRSFTHQMVRQRTAVYAQESLRFAVVDGTSLPSRVQLPPSLAGTTGGEPLGAERNTAEWQRNVWDQALDNVGQAYLHLVESGIPAEDARGLLPHSVTTRLHYSTDLRALLDHAGNRLCTQAQFEWRLVFAKIAEAIRNYKPYVDAMRQLTDRWQYEAISNLFRPVCYATGKCEFMAEFDRACSIRDRVQANHAAGRPSYEWEKPLVGPIDSDGIGVKAMPIQPAEWLLDPGAAR